MTKYGKITTVLLTVWFAAVFSTSAAHLFKNGSAQFGLGVAVAALAPMIVFSVWFAASEGFRNFVLSLNPTILTSVGAGVEDYGIHVPFAAGAKRVASDLFHAGGIWRHVHWSYGRIRGLETCGACASQRFYFLAGAGNTGPDYGREPGYDGRFD